MSTAPFDVDVAPSGLETTGLRLNALTGLFLDLLATHFSSASHIRDPLLQGYIWSGDATLSKILIVPSWKWQTADQQRRPAVVIRRDALQFSTLGLADGAAMIGDRSDTQIPSVADEILHVLASGSHTLFALSAQAGQAERIADEVAIRILHFQQVLRKEFGFHTFRVAGIGPLSEIEEASEYFTVPVTVAYSLDEAWRVPTEAPFLKRIVVTTQQE